METNVQKQTEEDVKLFLVAGCWVKSFAFAFLAEINSVSTI
jgi:hypothetical protein